MNTQDESAVSDVSEQTEPDKQATEQTKSESKPLSPSEELLRFAAEEGHEIGPPKAEVEVPPEFEPAETEPEEKAPETDVQPKAEEKADDKKEEKPEEEKPEKKGDEWPDSAKQRVAEEADKRRRANDRADKAESLAREYEQRLAQATAPVPTEDNPFIDIQDVSSLDRLERSYENAIDLADENLESAREDGTVTVAIGKNPDGTEKIGTFTPEQLSALKRKAEKAIRKQIPDRRTYLQQRAANDAQAIDVYPELKDPDSEFTKTVQTLAYRLITGQAQKEPDVLIWVARAVKQYLAEGQRNGNGKTPEAKTPETKRILDSARQKIAPTPTRARSFNEHRSASSSALEKARLKFEERGDFESAEEYLNLQSSLKNKGQSNQLEPLPE